MRVTVFRGKLRGSIPKRFRIFRLEKYSASIDLAIHSKTSDSHLRARKTETREHLVRIEFRNYQRLYPCFMRVTRYHEVIIFYHGPQALMLRCETAAD